VAAVLPVPEVYWVDRDGRWFDEPALIYSFSSGVAKPKSFANQRVTGLGTNFGPLRGPLAQQFVESLARLHTLDLRSQALGSFDIPAVGSTEAAQWQLHRALRCWEEDRAAPSPLMDLARGWLQRHLPTLDRASLLHGDYRSGNFLYDEPSGNISCILDWERCTIGDRHRDLAWATSEAIGHYDETGQYLLVCGLMPLGEFLSEYERASGLKVDPERLRYYTILSRYQQAATVMGTGYRVVRLRRSHQDILLARIEAASYVLLEELRQSLAWEEPCHGRSQRQCPACRRQGAGPGGRTQRGPPQPSRGRATPSGIAVSGISCQAVPAGAAPSLEGPALAGRTGSPGRQPAA